MSVKNHYDNHLAPVYAWMAGDLTAATAEFTEFLKQAGIINGKNRHAIDLGAGHGIQSVAMAKLGFRVTAIDFSELLLSELRHNTAGMNVTAVNADIRNFRAVTGRADLVVCCGDTLCHLESESDAETLLYDIAGTLHPGGSAIFTFRDYSVSAKGNERIIPVKSDENRILTVILDYEPTHLQVTDLLYEKKDGVWKQKVSSYRKVRLVPGEVAETISRTGLRITHNSLSNGRVSIIARKQMASES